MNEQISKNVTLAKVIYSNDAKRFRIDNTPTQAQYNMCQHLCYNIIEPTFIKFGRIGWSSFFRSFLLNKKIKGASTSDHQANIGAAVDFDTDIEGNISNAELFHWLKYNVEFDQLIWEFGNDKEPAWVHISYRPGNNRKQVIRSRKNSKDKTYYEFI